MDFELIDYIHIDKTGGTVLRKRKNRNEFQTEKDPENPPGT